MCLQCQKAIFITVNQLGNVFILSNESVNKCVFNYKHATNSKYKHSVTTSAVLIRQCSLCSAFRSEKTVVRVTKSVTRNDEKSCVI